MSGLNSSKVDESRLNVVFGTTDEEITETGIHTPNCNTNIMEQGEGEVRALLLANRLLQL